MTEKKRKLGSTALRIVSVLPLIPAILYLMFWGPRWAFHVFTFVAIAISAWELMCITVGTADVETATVETAATNHSFALKLWGACCAMGLAATVVCTIDTETQAQLGFSADARWLLGVMVVMAIGALASGLLKPDPVEHANLRTGWLLGGPIYVGLLTTVDLLHAHGGAWVLLAMLIAWLSDTAAYFAGRAFGKHKLYPKLSPKKTIEGALGGVCGSVVGALVVKCWLLPQIPWLHAIALAIVAGMLGQAGDLLESLIKRSAGVKDSGKILPGHGGLLDRVDALMFTAAATWVYAEWLLPT